MHGGFIVISDPIDQLTCHGTTPVDVTVDFNHQHVEIVLVRFQPECFRSLPEFCSRGPAILLNSFQFVQRRAVKFLGCRNLLSSGKPSSFCKCNINSLDFSIECEVDVSRIVLFIINHEIDDFAVKGATKLKNRFLDFRVVKVKFNGTRNFRRFLGCFQPGIHPQVFLVSPLSELIDSV